MSTDLPNNKTSHLKQNIYATKQNSEEPAKRPRNVRQDKGFLTNARVASRQPVQVDKQSRAKALYSKTPRSQNRATTRVKLIHTTLWLHPLVRAEFERIAEREKLSVSSVGATACEEWVRYDIHRQQSAILRTELRQLIREELAAFGKRIVFFLMRIAFSAEQARILITNVLKVLFQMRGKFDEKSYYTLVDESAKLARRNILRNTPQIKSLLNEYESSFTDDRGEEAKN